MSWLFFSNHRACPARTTTKLTTLTALMIAAVGLSHAAPVRTQGYRINNPTPDPGDNFGFKLAVTNSKLAVSDPQDLPGTTNSGSVYIYPSNGTVADRVRSNLLPEGEPGNWGTLLTAGANTFQLSLPDTTQGNRITRILSDGPTTDQFFTPLGVGPDVSIAGITTSTIVIGDPDPAAAGKAFIYDMDANSNIELINPETAVGDLFGASVAVIGSKIVVSAPKNATGAGEGKLHIFDSLDGSFINSVSSDDDALLSGSLNRPNARLVPLNDTELLVGLPDYEDKVGNPGGYVVLVDVVNAIMVREFLNPSGGKVGDRFGAGLAVKGTDVIVGAPLYDVGPTTDAGKGFLFDGTTGMLKYELLKSPADRAPDDRLGFSAASDGYRIFLGAINDLSDYTSPATPSAGSVLAFIGELDEWDPQDDAFDAEPTVIVPTETMQDHGPHVLSVIDIEDWFSIDMEAGIEYHFDTLGGYGNIVGQLYYPNMVEAANDWVVTPGDEMTSITFRAPVSGTYYLQLHAEPIAPTFLREANYGLRYVITDNPLDEFDHEDDITSGASRLFCAALEEQSHGPHMLSQYDSKDWFRVYLTAGIEYNFNSIGGTGDVLGGLFFDSNGDGSINEATELQLGSDDEGGDGQFSITYTPTVTGEYFLLVTTKIAPDAEYDLHYMRTTPDDAYEVNDNFTTGASILGPPLLAPQSHPGHTLSSVDSEDWYKVPLEAFSLYSFSGGIPIGQPGGVASGDTLIELYAPDATLLVASDDNSGGGDGIFHLTFQPLYNATYYLRVVHGPTADCSTTNLDAKYDLIYRELTKDPVFSEPDNVSGDPPATNGNDQYPQLASDGNGKWVAVWMTNDSLGADSEADYDIAFSRSSDNGQTWSAPIFLNSNAATDVADDKVPTIGTDKAGNWVAVWSSYNGVPPNELGEGDIYFARSTDNGATWSPAAPLNTNAATDNGEDWVPQVRVDGAGNWIVTWQSSDTLNSTIGPDWDVLYARSTDAGITWSAPAPLNSNAASDVEHDWEPQLAVDGAGKWVAVWMRAATTSLDGEAGKDWDIYFATSTNGGQTWSNRSAVHADAPTDFYNDQFPTVASYGPNLFIVLWQSKLPGAGTTADIVYCTGDASPGTWSTVKEVYADFLDRREDEFPKVAADPFGNVMAVWYSRDVLGDAFGSKSDAVFSIYRTVTDTWDTPDVLNTTPDPLNPPKTSKPGTKHEFDPGLFTDGAGTWIAGWSSDDMTNNIAGPDFDILLASNVQAILSGSDPFDTGNVTPPGSLDGWSAFGTLDPALGTAGYDAIAGAYQAQVFASPDKFRNVGLLANKAEWLPYTSVGSNGVVRAKFFVYASGMTDPSELNQMPNFRLRLANRFAVTQFLEVMHHRVGDNPLVNELRPSTNPAAPSLYRMDFNPVDVPYLQTSTSGEGIVRGFEAFCLEPQENGTIALTESEIGFYPQLATNGALVQTYQTGAGDAGDLKIFDSSTDLFSSLVIPSATVGEFPAVDNVGTQPSYSEGFFGITMDSTAVASDRIALMTREFFPGADLTQRPRIEPGKQYRFRYHVTSTQQSNLNAKIALRARTVRFGWSNRLEIGGAFGTGGVANDTIAQQALPGIGCLNPEKDGAENGGWYTLIITSPLNSDIRPETGDGETADISMPNIMAEPGPGVNAPSVRDIRVAADLTDSISAGINSHLEAGNFTIDRIEVYAFTEVDD